MNERSKEYNVKRITKEYLNRALEVLKGEVKVYSQYLEGDVYRIAIFEDDEMIDTCGGFYDLEDAKSDAISIAMGYPMRGVA